MKSTHVHIRTTQPQKDLIKEQAAARGMTVTQYLLWLAAADGDQLDWLASVGVPPAQAPPKEE